MTTRTPHKLNVNRPAANGYGLRGAASRQIAVRAAFMDGSLAERSKRC